jgi:hypothetical protein
MRLAFLLLILPVLAIGCAPQRQPESKAAPESPIEQYVEKPISISRYLKYMEYKRKLAPSLPNSREVPKTPQWMLENTCGVCVIKSIGDYFGTNWKFEDIRDAVLGTHEQGTSVTAIAKWFNANGYAVVDYRRGDRSVSSLQASLDSGCLVVALIYSFRDGYGPNHFVIATDCDGKSVNIVDSRIGTYSESADMFMGRQVLVQGTWLAVKNK